MMNNCRKSLSLLVCILIIASAQSKKVLVEANDQLRQRAFTSSPSFLEVLYDKPNNQFALGQLIPATPPAAPVTPIPAPKDAVNNVYIPSTVFPIPTMTDAQVSIIKSFEFFLTSLTAETLVKNTTNCFYRMTNFTIIQTPRFFYNLLQVFPTIFYVTTMEDPPVGANILTATNTISFYSSAYIQNFTNHLWVCNDMLKNVYKYSNARVLQYNKALDVFTSFF